MLKYEQLSDLQLLEKLKTDDHHAFRVLYERYKSKIYYFVADISQGNYYLAEEIVQMAFVKLWESRYDLIIKHSLFNYLYTISRNLFINYISKKLREELSFENLQKVSGKREEPFFDEMDLKLLITEIERLIARLPSSQQQVYRLKHFEQMSQKEIAEKLGISENTVESYQKHSNKYLRMMLNIYKKEILNGIVYLTGLFLPF